MPLGIKFTERGAAGLSVFGEPGPGHGWDMHADASRLPLIADRAVASVIDASPEALQAEADRDHVAHQALQQQRAARRGGVGARKHLSSPAASPIAAGQRGVSSASMAALPLGPSALGGGAGGGAAGAGTTPRGALDRRFASFASDASFGSRMPPASPQRSLSSLRITDSGTRQGPSAPVASGAGAGQPVAIAVGSAQQSDAWRKRRQAARARSWRKQGGSGQWQASQTADVPDTAVPREQAVQDRSASSASLLQPTDVSGFSSSSSSESDKEGGGNGSASTTGHHGAQLEAAAGDTLNAPDAPATAIEAQLLAASKPPRMLAPPPMAMQQDDSSSATASDGPARI